MDTPFAGPLDALARSPLFAGLPRADLEALAAIAVPTRHAAGETLFLEGDAPTGLHLVLDGAVKVFKTSAASGREMILAVERPGQAVAELPSLDGEPYPANAEALGPTATLFLRRDRLEALLLERPNVTRHLLRTVGTRLRHLVGLVEALSFQHVVGRLAAHLLERAAEGVPFQLETNAMIAARLGTVGELVTRNLSRLSGNGLVRVEGRTVVDLDRAGLVALVERGA